MYKLIFSTIRQRRKVFTGTFISIVLAMMLLTMCWSLLFSAISGYRIYGTVDYIGSISLFGTLSGLTIFAAIFVIIGTVSFSIQERYNNIALLRGIGLTPRQIRRMLSAEMNLYSIFGFLLGAPLGISYTPFLLEWFINLGAVPKDFIYSVTAFNLLMVFGVGFIVLHIAAYFSARRIVKISPTEAFRESTVRTKSTGIVKSMIGWIFVFGAIAILIFVPQQGAAGIGYNFLASLCFIIGIAVLGDLIVKIISLFIRVFFRLFGATGSLACSNSKIYSYRMANAALSITLMIALNGGILINTLTFNENMLIEDNSYYNNKTVIYNQQGFDSQELRDIKSVFNKDIYEASVESEVDYYGLKGDKYKRDDYDILGVINKYESNEVSVSKKLADKFNINIGDNVEVYFNGKDKVEVIPVDIHNRNDYGKADFVMNHELIHAHDDKAVIETIIFDIEKTGIESEMTQLLQKWSSDIIVNPDINARQETNLKIQNAVIYMMILISLAFSIIAVINTFSITIASRKAEYKNLWLIGMTKNQINRMLNLESNIIIMAGLLLGAIINSACIGTFNRANGYSNGIVGNPSIYFALIGVGFLVGFFASRAAAAKEVNQSIGRIRYE